MKMVYVINELENDIICEIIDDSDGKEEDEEPNEPPMNNTEVSLLGITKQPLEFRYMAGGNLVKYPPLFALYQNFILFRDEQSIYVYSTVSGERVRELVGPKSKIISMQFELSDAGILVACTEDGNLFYWYWQTGELKSTIKISFTKKGEVLTFNLLNFYEDSTTACAFVVIRLPDGKVNWFILNTTTGKFRQAPMNLRILDVPPKVAVESRNFHYIVVAQHDVVYFIDYRNWRWRKLRNARECKVTALAVHPSEALVATGDERGQIFLWRDFFNQLHFQNTVLYHWHHTAITSIAFTEYGTSFYSSGHEAVLVRWNIARPEVRNFLPRLNSITLHIVVKPNNTQVALCTADNGIQFLDADIKITGTLQEFTYSVDDNTGLEKFPVGLQRNPRSNTLVLNGRVGHLQFYSVYTRTLLYNLNIVNQNPLSRERDRILYDIRITKAAFNIDWMATGEVFNDQQHIPELRLKFWRFHEKEQCYELNTNVEMPHEKGFRSIQFSNNYQVDNLLCATIGEDNLIRVWALRKSDNIYRLGSVAWCCIGQASYHNMPVHSLSFSNDGSIIAAGFGNTLCIYRSENFQLKVVLSCPAGIDGVVQKVRVHLPNQNLVKKYPVDLSVSAQKEFLKCFIATLEGSNKNDSEKFMKMISNQQIENKPATRIDGHQKVLLFKKIIRMNNLSSLQKLQIFQKLQIPCEFEPPVKDKITDNVKRRLLAKNQFTDFEKMNAKIYRLDCRERFKAKYRLRQHFRHILAYDMEVTQSFDNLLRVMGLDNSSHKTNTNDDDSSSDETEEKNYRLLIDDLPPPACITHVQFASGENAHLVVVCTNTRVLIWNLLTLRCKFYMKIATRHLAYDPTTNLVAIVSHHNELHIFEPHMPVQVYKRTNLPDVIGICWLPRRNPKSSSIYINWQSQSFLYFLTSDQKIKYLASPNDRDDDCISSISLPHVSSEDQQYTTFGTHAIHKHSDKDEYLNKSSGPLVFGDSGRAAVKMLSDMSSHTMPPLSLICGEFLQALARPAGSPIYVSNEASNSKKQNGSKSDSETEDLDDKHKIRKSLMSKSEELKTHSKPKEPTTEADLKKLHKRLSKMKLYI